MSENLTGTELAALIQRVFQPTSADRTLAVLVDLPDKVVPDRPEWKVRREMAAGWVKQLKGVQGTTGLEPSLCVYRNAHMNNADLPEEAWIISPDKLPGVAEECDPAGSIPLSQVLCENRILLAPTEFSATAPLKMSGPVHGFRAATMPGFSPEMIPALRLDYGEINRRVNLLKELLDRAVRADIRFKVDGSQELDFVLDLRHRTAHASGGLLPEPGTAGNLPSGETYIVPYEGELPNDPSGSHGSLPVQFEDGLVIYQVEQNRAISVAGEGEAALREAKLIEKEPAYGNMAEMGLGVLADFGVQPSGEILLDEKLGLHIAFGRSEHFGGQVGPAQFSSPEAVVHIDRVYVPSVQPRISVAWLDLQMDDASTIRPIEGDRYIMPF